MSFCPRSNSVESTPSSGTTSPPPSPRVSLAFKCGICLDSHPMTEVLILCAFCPARYCGRSMLRYLKEHTENRFYPIECPGCAGTMDAWGCVDVLNTTQPATANALTSLILERVHIRTLKSSNKRCSTPYDFVGNPGGRGAKVVCPLCNTATCVLCGCEWHGNKSCAEVSTNAPLAKLAETHKWKQCPICKNLVEKNGGCPHIMCRCGTGFCYTCGEEFADDEFFCACDRAEEPGDDSNEPSSPEESSRFDAQSDSAIFCIPQSVVHNDFSSDEEHDLEN